VAWLTPRRHDHDHYSQNADRRPQEVLSVGAEPIHDDAPRQGQSDEHPAVGRVDSASNRSTVEHLPLDRVSLRLSVAVPPIGGTDVSEQNKSMVRRLVEAINTGDEPEAVDELFAPRAARRVKRLFAEFRRAFPDWREEIVTLVAEENAVAGRFRCSGTHRGQFLGEAPTGRRMEVEEVFFLRAEDGKFIDFWALEDSMGRMRQLGLLPPRGGGS
jgi:predicted ester cyclase